MRTAYLLLIALGGLSAGIAQAQRVCDAKAFGAKGDGVTEDTASLQRALDTCATARGGGVVRIAGAPLFVSAPLRLPSHTTLEIAAGTTLAGSEDHTHYPEMELFHEHARQPLLLAEDAEDITIRGGGTIDGRGQSWWPDRSAANVRPRLIVFSHSRHILMEDVTVQNSPSWQIVPYYSDDVTFRNLRIFAPIGPAHNTDGIDPFSSGHVLIEHTTIDTGDDNVAIKSGQPGSPGPDAPAHDITIRDCIFLHGHGLSVGSEVSGGVQNVLAERIQFRGTNTGIRIKSNRDRGNDIGPLTYRDLTMEDVPTPILISEFYPKIPPTIAAEPVTRLTPHFHDIRIEHVHATGAKEALLVVGLPESPVLGLTLQDVHLSAKTGARLQYVHLQAEDVSISAETGSPVTEGPGVEGKLLLQTQQAGPVQDR